MNCFKCNKELIEENTHDFAGYEYYIQFCKKCCPVEYDSSVCELHGKKSEKHQKRLLKLIDRLKQARDK